MVLTGRSRGILRARSTTRLARVVKLVDTGDLKSPGHCGRAGSNPAPGTTPISIKTYSYMFSEARASTLISRSSVSMMVPLAVRRENPFLFVFKERVAG